MILYIHGFNSSGFSETAEKVRNYFGKENVFSPTLPPSPKEAINILQNAYNSLVREGNDVTVIGNSLGGFYALYLHHLNDCRTILINPSVYPHKSLSKAVGKQKNYITGEEYEFKKEYIDELIEIYNNFSTIEHLNIYLHIFWSLKDELISHSATTLRAYPYAHTQTCCFNSTHRFENLEYYLPTFKEISEGKHDYSKT